MTTASRKNWFQRNWPWVVPVGCGGALVLVGGGIFAILALVTGLIISSDPYQIALGRAKASAEVMRALGTPVEEGFLTQGQIKLQNNDGNANFQIPISGPSGSGTIHVVAVKRGGTWTYSRLEVVIHGSGERITLPP